MPGLEFRSESARSADWRSVVEFSIVNVCYVYPYEIGDGAKNMSLDEALLEAIGRVEADALLRVYGWSVPTLSLGYFQRLAEARADERWRDVPIVRRPTGGGAIWHEHELTYALVVPESHPLARPSTQLYRKVHAAISGGLVGLGIAAVRRGEVFPPGDCERSRPILCFSNLGPEDIVLTGNKIVGSAQRRAGGLSSNMGPFFWHSQGEPPNCREFMILHAARPIPGNGPRGWWSGSRRRSVRTRFGRACRRRSACRQSRRARTLSAAVVDRNSVMRLLEVRVSLFNLRKIKIQ